MIKILSTIFFVLCTASAVFAQSAITGIVTDSKSGSPIPGANVQIKGTSTGVVTDFDGNYSISAESGQILVFTYLGFKPKEVIVSTMTTVNVSLESSTSELDEIVVVGYTEQKKSSVTSAVSEVKSKELTDVTTSDVSTMLQGKAAGVQVVQGSGQPGSLPSVRIRGLTSINGGTNPLWVLDGVIVHGTPNLNPNDVEGISVLKDASATALYGSRGANGVVVVTTKQAKLDQNTLTISSRLGYSYFNNGNFETMNSQQLYDYYQSFGNQDNIPEGIDESVLANDFDWFENGTQTGVIQDHNLTFTGGNEKSKTFLSLGYYNETGTLKGYKYDRVSARLNHDYKIGERLTLKPKVAVNYNKRNNRQHSLYALYTYMPWDTPTDINGTIINPQDLESGQIWYGRDNANYLYNLQYNYSNSRELNLFSNMDLEYQILPDLKFISTNSVTFYYADGMTYTDPKSTSGLANNGQLYKYNTKRITNFTNQMLKYSKSMGAHRINALLGYEYQDYKYTSSGATGYGIVSGTTILDNAATPGAVSGTTNDSALQSVLFNADYGYDNRYLAQFSIRRDGASNFGKDNQYGTFYSGSLGWNIHNESFFKVKEINQLKLRASYGAVGNRPAALYPQYDLYSLQSTYNGLPAPSPYQYGNDDLAWEISYQTNIGLDSRFFDRASFSLEYYNKDTSDLLYYVILPSTSGYNGYYENIGGVVNTGFEANLSVDIFQENQSGFGWTITGNIGTNSNEVTELFEGEDIDRGTKLSRVGEDYNTWFMRKWLGVDSETGNPLWETVDPNTGERSETTDYNAATKQIVGSSTPDFYGGFSSMMLYKGFSLSANFNFSQGGQIYHSSRELYDADGAYPTYNQQVLQDGWSRWEEPGDIATHPRALYGGNNLSNKTSSRYLEDASYLRMRNIRLGYTFSQKWLSDLHMSNFEVYLTGDNLLTITDFSGTDPEVGIDGYASSQYPISKRIAFGLNLSF
ncbi:SusC/RagA family TonB-linked outer membrane protein [Leeuwenhoekiella palythoae]|uniref:TonB-linked SusC/RagA family outer membrane protein n=1 Tax=Leeuwenhoekiella palythoae TaxID=573501 RepID=A0A1M5SC38_9FLAO|nr:TonB-dependent receptor [Leeuwenhoekiella palythoae]RXG29003.1 TonB-linked SusC/RagA family outer membrane protein [Leeuwenhoekiella palythoae]SHH36076.1 TonB-linked outer membrane protein, SusC/RagA family [Leeuwenhoekiella palythoae]